MQQEDRFGGNARNRGRCACYCNILRDILPQSGDTQGVPLYQCYPFCLEPKLASHAAGTESLDKIAKQDANGVAMGKSVLLQFR